MIKNNLAEAYLKGGKLDKAEAEYKRILSITANHVESEIGLGQVYTAMAEGCRDGDFYDEAIHHFKRAIDMAKNNSSKVSKKMTSQEWAAVYYASGYARVKLHGCGMLERILSRALTMTKSTTRRSGRRKKSPRSCGHFPRSAFSRRLGR
jgi:tetratricopeptide (TPR) repeat protein